MKKSLFFSGFIMISALMWIFPCSLFSQSISKEIKLYSELLDRKENVYIAQGNVRLEYIKKKITVLAEYIQYNSETKDVFAKGNVTILLPNENIRIDSINFNLDSWQGTIEKVQGMAQPSVYYEAEQGKLLNRNEYELIKGKVTSCAQPVPRWKFSFSKAKFKKDDSFQMWNAVFSIKKIPIFYLPYIKYPLGQGRKTGLLTPQLGYSTQKGIFFSQGFFWAIKRNMDATLNLDYYGARGLGAGLEYRYMFNENAGGQLKFYYFNFKENPNYTNPEKAYIVRLNHNQPLPFNIRLVANVDYQSSFDFLREFDDNYQRALISNRRSQIFLSRSWSHFNMNARLSRFETHYTELNRSIIRQNLPEFQFSSNKIKLFSPLLFSFSTRFSSWEQGWEDQFKNGTQKHSQNLTIAPALTLPFNSIPWMTLTSSVGTNLTYYFQSYAPSTTKIVNEPLLSNIYYTNFEFIGPVFSKIYYKSDKTPKFKHIIEPEFGYRYDSPVEESNRFISARFFYRNHYIKYGITNRFLIKKENSSFEVLTLSLKQYHYMEPDESPLRIYSFNGEIPKLSDIEGYFRFIPGRKYNFDFAVYYNPYYKTLSRIRLGGTIGSSRDPAFLTIRWSKSINPYRKISLLSRNHILLSGGLKIPSLKLESFGVINYNLQKKKMLYSAYSLVYHYQCLDFQADFRVFYFRATPEFQFRFSFGLGNIGKTTDFFGGLDF